MDQACGLRTAYVHRPLEHFDARHPSTAAMAAAGGDFGRECSHEKGRAEKARPDPGRFDYECDSFTELARAALDSQVIFIPPCS